MAQSIINLEPRGDKVIVAIYDDGQEVIKIGDKEFYTLDDKYLSKRNTGEEKHRGARGRFGLVLAVSDDAEKIGIFPRNVVFMEPMEWGRPVKLAVNGNDWSLWPIPCKGISLVADEDELTEWDRERINKICPGWEKCEIRKWEIE